MDIIIKRAENFAKNQFSKIQFDSNKVISSTRSELYDIDNVLDKIKYLNIILDTNSTKYEQHKRVCETPETCKINISHETVAYYLSQELSRLGMNINDDAFTAEDKKDADDKLDKILQEIQTLKDGQNIIYDDLVKEINDLRDLYYLGKKKWQRQLIGTGAEMIASGIISETISKNIIETVKGSVTQLIG